MTNPTNKSKPGDPLTARETEALGYLVHGCGLSETARLMAVTPQRVRQLKRRIVVKGRLIMRATIDEGMSHDTVTKTIAMFVDAFNKSRRTHQEDEVITLQMTVFETAMGGFSVELRSSIVTEQAT